MDRARITKGTKVSLLTATMPTTPADALHLGAGTQCDLPGVMMEEKHVRELVAGTIPVEALPSPSVALVIDKMRDCSIAHFACHGSTDHADPSNSGLILQRQDDHGLKQDRLTVRRVSELSLAGAHIA
ncbi:TPR Domain containing protein [Purpureocillium lavendulum]|uniref:TPR Domain containing protein n=1 Tax=Purpureocillium lavendulum TaxID=1247861 RepID=A0AB34FBX5_9HYPO|nr:TPR Domain containing protein [Purpureocillium lavendulum]